MADPLVFNGLPLSGTTAQRPSNASTGQLYWDRTINKLMIYDDSLGWQEASGGDAADPGNGAAAGTGVAAEEYGTGGFHKTVITFTNLSVTMTDAGANGCHGAQKFYDFPAGLVEILGVTTDLTTLAGSGGIADNAALVGSIGTATVGTGNATLTDTEADLLPSTSGTLSSGAGTLKGDTVPTVGTLAGIAVLTDNSAGTANDTIQAMADPTDTPATADALRDDLVANLLPAIRNNIADLTAKVNGILNNTKSGRRVFDGTSTAIDAYLNLAVPDAGSSASDTITVNGTITILWVNYGDN